MFDQKDANIYIFHVFINTICHEEKLNIIDESEKITINSGTSPKGADTGTLRRDGEIGKGPLGFHIPAKEPHS